jgi:formylglycine-generating enzyme required for sulfatase activity
MAEAVTINPARRLVISRQTHQGQYFTEPLTDSISLDMMLIPGGSFQMGQTEAEKTELIRLVGEERYQQFHTDELPRHQVTVPSFFMGKYPITQAQWRAVATNEPIINQKLDPDPVRFKGDQRDDHPIENVSWADATEFCQRLSAKTKRTYRLPSEAEWEYACRAGTITPFHFGETISDELANYSAQDREIDGTLYPGTYGRGIAGQYRQKTTPVGQFPANQFGLYDMHGNVWEWCADLWHQNYVGAPNDGSAWLKENDNDYHLLRGGSWDFNPGNCRSASRNYDFDDDIDYNVGFRVCCERPRILLSP